MPARVAACSCAAASGYVRWPKPDAVDVPIDTPIVVMRYSADAALTPFVLRDTDGNEVALVQSARMESPPVVCGPGESLFLRPEEPLRPNTQYRGEFFDPPLEGDFGTASFTTGAGVFEAELDEAIETTYLTVTSITPCAADGCLGIGELTLQIEPERPRWLEVRSAASTHAHNLFAAWTKDRSEAWPTLSVALPPDDDCVDIRVVGLEGRNLFEARRCTPDHCARSDLVGTSSCDDPPFSPVDYRRLPDGSCDDPAGFPYQDGVGLLYPGDDGYPDDGSNGGNDPDRTDGGAEPARPGRPRGDVGIDDSSNGSALCAAGGGIGSHTSGWASLSWLTLAAALLARRRTR